MGLTKVEAGRLLGISERIVREYEFCRRSRAAGKDVARSGNAPKTRGIGLCAFVPRCLGDGVTHLPGGGSLAVDRVGVKSRSEVTRAEQLPQGATPVPGTGQVDARACWGAIPASVAPL